MADKGKAADKNEVNLTWEQVVAKYSGGVKYTGKSLYERIINAS